MPVNCGTGALSNAEFAARMAELGPFEPNPHLAVGLSGGVDSLTLLAMAKDWAGARGGRVTALIIDHGLRQESAKDAHQAQTCATALGASSEIITWQHDGVTSAIQAKARHARYGLLDNACGKAGILHLLIGHHHDDQAETIAMRQEAGSGPLGQAGMNAVRLLEHCQILRPFLPWPRARIEATAKQLGLRWLEDPSNLSAKFWRGRSRLGSSSAQFTQTPGWRRQQMQSDLAKRMASGVVISDLGVISQPVGDDDLADPDILAQMIATSGGHAYLRDFAADFEQGSKAWTAGGTIICRQGGFCHVLREPARAAPAMFVPAGMQMRWDRRWVICNIHAKEGMIVRASAESPLAKRIKGGPRPASQRAALPSLSMENGQTAASNPPGLSISFEFKVFFGAEFALSQGLFMT